MAEYVIEQFLREENGGVQRTATRRRGRNALYFRAPKAFFRELGNWFMPFTTEHSAFGNQLSKNQTEKDMLDSMTLAAFMCNSDKYSLYFSMMQLPDQARQMMMGQFGSQASEMIQQTKEELISKRGKLEIISGQYIQDLYRFFKLYPGHLDFDDIFTSALDFHNLPILQPYVSDEESLTTIAEYYLRKNYFLDALTIYNRLSDANQESDILFQKIGYCKQMNGDIQGALRLIYMRILSIRTVNGLFAGSPVVTVP